jgi:hypothetical protein
MKKFFIFGMIGAMALSFNACTSDDEVANEKIDQKEVKTRFALSLTNSVKTRMDANLAQVDEQFRGMSGIQVFTFNDDVTANSTIANNPIALADFTAFDAENVNAKVYTDVTIPVGTSDFLFYGKIADNGDEGELIASYDKETLQLGASVADAINFDLVPIVDDIDFSGGDDIVAGLNAVYAAIPEDPSWDELRAAFQSLKAGSWCSVAAFMEDMYQAVVAGDPNETTITGAIEAAGFVTDNGYAVVKDNGFPRDLGLPDGAVQVAFADGEFAYTYPSVDGMDVPAMTAYTLPAELYYTVNTKGVIDEETTHAPNFNNYEVWNDVITTEYAENVAPVTLTTKSVVLLDQVQYAVGRLDATVKVSAETVKDSGAEGGVANYVAVPADGYPVTGILIGGQKQVTWDFTPVEDADEFTIYDANVEGAAVVGTASEPMYTLALETASDQVVNIAVEFENTGDDFYGVNHQVIPAGTKFYLVAQLDPTKAKNYAQGTLDKVFFQDHATKLDLTIGELSLQNAYNVVPDLRSPKLEFGLSVNLEWLEGLIFEHTF